jgi:subtilisin-like proprotein convertase family protein
MRTCINTFAALLISGVVAGAQPLSFTNSSSAVIPDGNPNGVTSDIFINGVGGMVTNLSVSLQISGGFNGDLFAYLYSDNGGFAVLLNRIGKTSGNPFGSLDTGLNLTLSDTAPTDVHYADFSGAVATGIWQPDGRNVDPQIVNDTYLRDALLDAFTGRTPNGTWTLFLADLAGGGEATRVAWTISFNVVPEPGVTTLLLMGGGMVVLARRFISRSGRDNRVRPAASS